MLRLPLYCALCASAISVFLVPLNGLHCQEDGPEKTETVKPAIEKENRSKVLATVNGEPVTEGEVDLLHRLKGSAYQKDYVTQLVIQRKAAEQFLDEKGITVAEELIDKEVKRGKERLKGRGMDFADMLEKLGVTEKDFRDEIEFRMRLAEYVEGTTALTEEEIIENMGRVSASHILISTGKWTDAEAEAEIEKIEKELRKAANLEEAFTEAAAKYSDCPSGKESNGRLRPFVRMEKPKSFSDVAFSLEKGLMSAPVKTQFGYHLILVHDRMPVTDEEFKKKGELLKRFYMELTKQNLVIDLTSKAKIIRYDTPDSSENGETASESGKTEVEKKDKDSAEKTGDNDSEE